MKRKRSDDGTTISRKSARIDQPETALRRPVVQLLKQYYRDVSTLRQFLVQKLPKRCKHRRRCFTRYGSTLLLDTDPSLHEAELDLLDNTLVGWNNGRSVQPPALLQLEGAEYRRQSQDHRQDDQSCFLSTQAEVIDFCLWKLQRRPAYAGRVQHVLLSQALVESGLASHENRNVQKLVQHPWTILPWLVGQSNTNVVSELFTNCGVFECVSDRSNIIQLSGPALNDLSTLSQLSKPSEAATHQQEAKDGRSARVRNEFAGHSTILFARHQILYAQPECSRNGNHRDGLPYKHILNRCCDLADVEQCTRVAKHIFPLQFGMESPFSSSISKKDKSTSQHGWKAPVSITSKSADAGYNADGTSRRKLTLPRRLVGNASEMVNGIRRRHGRLSYSTLIQHYCSQDRPPAEGTPMAQATSHAAVSAFARAAVLRVFGNRSFGDISNWRKVAKKIDHFVRLRRYEHMSMHEVLDGITVGSISWLAPTGSDAAQKMSQTDFEKRKQLLAEFLYFLFNDYLVTLIRSNFYVTESSSHRNRLFYFRHDVWRVLSAPAIEDLKQDMLETCNRATMKALAHKSVLAVSQIRFVPKDAGMRPIVNLRKKVQPYGRSINNILAPVHSVLLYEKSIRPTALGSGILSASEMLPKLAAFSHRLHGGMQPHQPLFFARLDIKSCFDSLPHDRLLQVAQDLLSRQSYSISKYASGRLLGVRGKCSSFAARPVWRYTSKAGKSQEVIDIEQEATRSSTRTHAVLIDLAAQRQHDRAALLALLRAHVEDNLIKIGRRVYRQRRGIAQGSIVSSMLCSLLYTELEREVLGVTNAKETMLIRLIDDFLLMSTRKDVVESFMQKMHAGLPEFGVQVKLKKSQVNFDLVIEGVSIPRLPAEVDFPFCGQTINTISLDIGKDISRKARRNVVDSLTIDSGRSAGTMFRRRMLQALRLQMQSMLLSTSHNSASTVQRNLQNIFENVARKTYCYVRGMSGSTRPSEVMIMRLIHDLSKLAHRSFSKIHKQQATGVSSAPAQVTTYAVERRLCEAFSHEFLPRQTQWPALLAWLRTRQAIG